MKKTIIAIGLTVLLLLYGSYESFHDAPSSPVSKASVPERNEAEATVVRVIDGDTIVVRLSGQQEEVTVRYIGIDTPEPYEGAKPECGSEAASGRNRALVSDQKVLLVPDKGNTDRYGRLLRYVYVGDEMINKTLLQEGYATAMSIRPNTKFAAEFAGIEAVAKEKKIGIWEYCPLE